MDEKSLPITPEASFKWETWSLMGMIPLSSILSFDLIPGSNASLLIVERNTSVGNVPMCSASQTAFSTFSDQLLKSANLRKIQFHSHFES
jgi:hypothetical protein